MGYVLGLPSLKLSNVNGKAGKHCGNFYKVAREALNERVGHDTDIVHGLTKYNYYEGFETAADLKACSDEWIANWNRKADAQNAIVRDLVDKVNSGRQQKLKLNDALEIVNAERAANGEEPICQLRKIRFDAVVMCVTIIKPPQSFMENLIRDDQQRFLLDALSLLKEMIGEDNVKAVVIHYDELVPHMHIFWLPITADGRLCAREVHNLQFLGQLNKEMPAYLRSKGWTEIDDCNAYDADEESRIKTELGKDAYEEYRRIRKAKNGRSSKVFKADMDKQKLALIEEVMSLKQEIAALQAEKAQLLVDISNLKR